MLPLSLKSFFHTPSSTWSHVLADLDNRVALIIDPVMNCDLSSLAIDHSFSQRQLDYIDGLNCNLQYVFETHVHADHLSDGAWLREQRNCKLVIGENVTDVQAVFKVFYNDDTIETEGQSFDRLVANGECIQFGRFNIEVIATPGHTPACVSYLIDGNIFVGDTLMAPDVGTARCDFPKGSATQLFDSIQKILQLDDSTRIFLCHDYPNHRDRQSWTTVAEEKANNIHVGKNTEKHDFIAKRNQRDTTLNAPAAIIPALQVNVRAGQLPQSKEDGHVYLKYPINKL